jgi:hypothetical protein
LPAPLEAGADLGEGDFAHKHVNIAVYFADPEISENLIVWAASQWTSGAEWKRVAAIETFRALYSEKVRMTT